MKASYNRSEAKRASKKAAYAAHIAAVTADYNAHEREHREEIASINAQHAAQLVSQKAAFDAANAAQEAAHAQAVLARKAHEAMQLASHIRQMKARKAHFEKEHSNTWSEATTGMSIIEVNIDNRLKAEELIKDLFWDFTIADVQEFERQTQSRIWVKDGRERIWGNQNLLTLVTTDDKLGKVKDAIERLKLVEQDLVPYDFITYSVATGSAKYIEWVKHQTSFVRGGDDKQGQEIWRPDGALAK